MKDQEIYMMIGEILSRETPIEGITLNVLCRINSDSVPDVDSCMWSGGVRDSRKGNLTLKSRQASRAIRHHVFDLKKWFLENDLGGWNVCHYKLDLSTGKFDVDFCDSKEIQEGMPFWKYAKKYHE